MNVNKLKGKIVEKEKNPEMMAEMLGISRASYYRKLNNPEEFTVGDIVRMKVGLDMSDTEACEIFL